MRLPFAPPLVPMLSKAADALPSGDGWQFEPKWDGFRTLVFRDGDEIMLQSRDEKAMNRYFPELVAPLAATLPERCVVDGEIVIVGVGGLDFEALLLRIHPAASRVKLLAAQSPGSFVAWDLLALGDEDLREAPLADRRERLERVLAGVASPVHLSPATRDRALATDWFRRFEGAGLAGVIAKRLDAPYRAGERTMIKVKHTRTADCVVAGFRWHKNGVGAMVGSLLLGLYDDGGTLHHVGVTAAFTNAVRKQLVAELAPLRRHALEGHPWRDWAEAQTEANATGQRLPGASSRWIRVHVDERPRIESTSTSSTWSRAAASGWRAFHRSRPASASSLCAALATVMRGWVDCRRPLPFVLAFALALRDGATRGGSPRCFV